MTPALAALFKLRPDRAADYLQAKGLQLTGPYWEMDGPAHSRAFTVANLAKIDVLADIKGAVQQAIDQGQTEKWFKDQLVEVLQRKGWWGKAVTVDPDTLEARIVQQGSLRRLQTIYRTNLQSAYMAGRHRQALEQADRAPFAQYLAVRDAKTRPGHAALHGQVFRLDSPAWAVIAPPNGYNSVLPTQRVSGHTFVGLKAWYAGPAVEIIGKSGSRCSVTAQHPVLTTKGWVAAGNLRHGDQLLGYRRDVGGGAMAANLDEHDPPPTIDEVFQTLGRGGSCAMPRAAMNLYGDALFLQSDVEVVTADRKLLDHFHAVSREFVAKLGLHHPHQAQIMLPGLSASDEVIGAERDGGAGNFGPLALSVGTKTQRDGRLPVDDHADLAQLARDALGASADSPGDLLDANPGLIPGDSFRWESAFEMGHIPRAEFGAGKSVGFRHGALGHATLADVFIGGLDVNPNAHRDILDAQAGLVECDEVVDLRRFEYVGHVYDLETATGCIIAYGGINTPHIILSNCRCRARYLSARELAARGLKPAEDVRVLERQPPGNPPVDPLTGETPARWVQRGVSVPDPLKPGERLTLWADPNWDHLPGSDGAERVLVDKLMATASQLGDGIKEAVIGQLWQQVLHPARLAAYAAWVDKVLAQTGARGDDWVIGYLSTADERALIERGGSVASGAIILSDRLLVGPKAKRHQTAGNALKADEWKQVPQLLAKPEAVLYDTINRTLLYVLPSQDGRKTKIVVEGGRTERKRGSYDSVRAAFKVEASSLSRGQFKLVRGKLE